MACQGGGAEAIRLPNKQVKGNIRGMGGAAVRQGGGARGPPASRVSESLKKRRKRRLLRVRYAERKGGARPAYRSLSRWMLTTGKFIQAKLTRVNTISKESFLW